ncbi:MAG: glycosyltransferase [Acetobacteraceae bacterium]|nr:glycosyltransferase [Acetobacteraceae bacterium]
MPRSGLSESQRLHPAHRLWRLLPAGPRRRLLAHGVALVAPRPDREPPPAVPGLAVAGEVARASGLGEAARLFHAAARQLGEACWLIDTGSLVPGEAPDLAVEGAPAPPPDGVPMLAFVNAPTLPVAAMRLGRRRMGGRRVIGHWVWELETAPATWAAGLRFVHEVWAPTRFTAAALAPLAARRGLTVRVVPYPVAAAPVAPAKLGRAAWGLPEDAVVTLVSASLASSMARKNPLAAIRAHRLAFGDRADRVLMLKLGHAEHYRDDLAALVAAAEGARNVIWETRTLSPAESRALTRCCDILLSLHRSEGFGLVPAEAMLLGKPVVATGWSGNMDFMDRDTAALVGYRLVKVDDPRGNYAVPGAVWAEPDVGEAARHLAHLAEDPAARAALGARAAASVAQTLGTRPLADALAALRG